jgi:hypothetical protein
MSGAEVLSKMSRIEVYATGSVLPPGQRLTTRRMLGDETTAWR